MGDAADDAYDAAMWEDDEPEICGTCPDHVPAIIPPEGWVCPETARAYVGERKEVHTAYIVNEKTDAIIAALRPTDTGWREITAEARNGDDVLAYDDETGDCHVSHWTGDYWYGPNGFKPTHWMPLPPAPTDTGANHD